MANGKSNLSSLQERCCIYLRAFSGDTYLRAPCLGRIQVINGRESTVRQRQVWSDTGPIGGIVFYTEEEKLIPSSPVVCLITIVSIRLSCSATYTNRFTVRYGPSYCYPVPFYVLFLSETVFRSSNCLRVDLAFLHAIRWCIVGPEIKNIIYKSCVSCQWLLFSVWWRDDSCRSV